ncbi:ATP-binding protein [Cellulophaga sp. HaHa_2_1]|uniref:HD domain-containing protein n=1 Tax=Cellulophaga sp. HaHa_2_1 TaxID=2749994 RepID=UPI001C4E888B|nr:ATP-binding protein [Cellulophaga sp. HaHa_2_1]QXP52858.1 ATP-binding protein [Cellulophaga sp. HaHa_2_1]
MNRFENTIIWQKTLGKQLEPDTYHKERNILRVEFEKFRENSQTLAGEIAISMPEFTVHDISHIDALWETANLLLGDSYELNPAEAFVLGGAFLIHDLGMGLASFPNGMDEIKKEPIWKDTVASELKKKLNRQIDEEDLKSIPIEIEKYATQTFLRINHAKQADKLALISWEDNKGNNLYLLDDAPLRESYGAIIGKIAYSHWWSTSELTEKLPHILGAPGMFPSSWTVDPVKLACILRVADASQIDDRRAPSFLKAIRKLQGESSEHWNFQQKLYQPRLERNRLIFTSKSNFEIDEVSSWWLCFDTLKMIDKELKGVDSLLTDTNRPRLQAIGVASIDEPSRLSKLVTVNDWQPVDTKIKVSNVAKLVGNLGGSQLYGENIIVPLRELIQNSSDAIRARRIIENEIPEFGTINICFGKDSDGDFIEIEDNGIGMSPKVLSGPFLDFGESFWGTSLMHQEIPQLEFKGFQSTGKFGIGFFSVFMWGSKVSIASKRFEAGRDETLILEFNEGLNSRPILRKAKKEEVIKDGGTRVKVWLSSSKTIDKLLEVRGRKRSTITKKELIESLCPSIDCNVILVENDKKNRIISANDWISLPPIDFIKRVIGKPKYKSLSKTQQLQLNKISSNIEVIKNEKGEIIGRALLYIEDNRQKELVLEGIVTVGGFKTTSLTGLIGVFKGRNIRASRDVGVPVISELELIKWANNQSKKLQTLDLNEKQQIACASHIRHCGGNTNNFKIAHHKDGMLNYTQLVDKIKLLNTDLLYIVHDASISIYNRENKGDIKFNDNVIWVEKGFVGIFQTKNIETFVWWPNFNMHDETEYTGNLSGLVEKAICEVWNCSITDLNNASLLSSDEQSYEGLIGKNGIHDIRLDHLDIMKKPI